MLSTRSRNSILAAAAALSVALASAPTEGADNDPWQQARDEFLQAYAQPGTAAQDGAQLQAYPLYPYLQAARLQYTLEQTADVPSQADTEAAAFLQKHAAEPVSRRLRAAWLHSLARRQDWTTYINEYRETADPTLRCQYLQAKVDRLPPGVSLEPAVAAEVVAQWLTPRQLPQECEPLFSWARQNGVVAEEHIEQRVRALLEKDQADFARTIATQLPAERAAPLLQWAALLQKPDKEIEALIAAPEHPVEFATLLAGWTKLARKNSRAAVPRYDRLVQARGLDAEQASTLALPLALSLAWDRAPEALAYFKRVSPASLDDAALIWKARAALWARDWEQTRAAIAAMSDVQRGEARWRYWSARAAEAEGDKAAAHALYESLQPDDNYYAAIAAARLKTKAQPHPVPLTVDAAQLKAVAAEPPLLRARELLLCQFRAEALTEWLHGLATLTPEQQKQAVALAFGWEWHDVAVATATQQKIFNDYTLLYPRPFDQDVHAAAKIARLPEALIYSVIRQESLFRPEARSSADALGLMQMQIATARRTARNFKRPRPDSADLFDPSVNIALGAAHLRELLDRFGGQTAVALAAYNAGPNAAKRWLPQREVDADIWIENIPYNETREYVQRIHWHSVVFSWLKNGKPQDTRPWLKPIGP